jgi:hypothetical protein
MYSKHLTWTKFTGGIRSWPGFNYDRDAVVNDPQSNTDVLVQWGNWSYFEDRRRVWTFGGSGEVPPRTAEDGDFLQMASEAFYAWPGGIIFLAVHCEIAVLTSADAAHAVQRFGFLSGDFFRPVN